jgi:hypothetical protein
MLEHFDVETFSKRQSNRFSNAYQLPENRHGTNEHKKPEPVRKRPLDSKQMYLMLAEVTSHELLLENWPRIVHGDIDAWSQNMEIDTVWRQPKIDNAQMKGTVHYPCPTISSEVDEIAQLFAGADAARIAKVVVRMHDPRVIPVMRRVAAEIRKAPVTGLDDARDVERTLESIYTAIQQDDIETATDVLFDSVDRWLSAGDEKKCDELLSKTDVERLPSSLIRSFLTITFAGKGRLNLRSQFYERAFNRMSALKGDEAAARLLGVLR